MRLKKIRVTPEFPKYIGYNRVGFRVIAANALTDCVNLPAVSLNQNGEGWLVVLAYQPNELIVGQFTRPGIDFSNRFSQQVIPYQEPRDYCEGLLHDNRSWKHPLLKKLFPSVSCRVAASLGCTYLIKDLHSFGQPTSAVGSFAVLMQYEPKSGCIAVLRHCRNQNRSVIFLNDGIPHLPVLAGRQSIVRRHHDHLSESCVRSSDFTILG